MGEKEPSGWEREGTGKPDGCLVEASGWEREVTGKPVVPHVPHADGWETRGVANWQH